MKVLTDIIDPAEHYTIEKIHAISYFHN
jgi:hypothetical protein